MYKKNIKKKSSLRGRPLTQLFLVSSLVFLCSSQIFETSAAERAPGGERQPLLRINTDERDLESNRECLQVLPQWLKAAEDYLIPLKKIDIPAALLAAPDPSIAEEEFNKVIQFLAYNDQSMRAAVIAEVTDFPGNATAQPVDFQLFLHKKAWEAATTGPFSSYLGELLDTIEKVQAKVGDLNGQNESLRTGYEKLLADAKAKETESQRTIKAQANYIATLSRRSNYQWVATIVVALLGGGAVWATHVWWK